MRIVIIFDNYPLFCAAHRTGAVAWTARRHAKRALMSRGQQCEMGIRVMPLRRAISIRLRRPERG